MMTCDNILFRSVGLNIAKYGAATKSIRGSTYRVHTVLTWHPPHPHGGLQGEYILTDWFRKYLFLSTTVQFNYKNNRNHCQPLKHIHQYSDNSYFRSLKIWQFQQKVFRLNRNSPTKERVTPSPSLRHVIITGPLMNNSWHVFLCTPPQRCIFPINLRKYGAIVADEWLPPFGRRKPTFGNPNVTLIELGVIFFSSDGRNCPSSPSLSLYLFI